MSHVSAVVVEVKEGALPDQIERLLRYLKGLNMDPIYDPNTRLIRTAALLAVGLPTELFACLVSGKGVFREMTEKVVLYPHYPEGLPA